MSHELSYQRIKTANEARISEEQRSEQRKRNLLLLVLHFFEEEGYLDSMGMLEKEAGVSLQKYEICDNIDLCTILQEYESYFFVKFNKWPKITKRVKDKKGNNPQISQSAGPRRKPPLKSKSNSFTLPNINNSLVQTNENEHITNNESPQKRPASDTKNKTNRKKQQLPDSAAGSTSDISLSGLSVQPTTKPDNSTQQQASHGKKTIIDYRAILSNTLKGESSSNIDPSERLLKPVAGFAGLSGEHRDLAAVVTRDIYLENPNVSWGDIIGLNEAKRLVKESVVYPIKYPQLFNGILTPWKGLLLYGPPGTGKTLLAKAVATECNTTFFNISASTIVSKWRGDSEKLVRVLFELARFHAPSTIFLDELDSLMGQRGAGGSSTEHEGSRRMKTELLVQMDGLSKSNDLVFLLAASNIPWELDHAMLRRLEKRILVDLPNKEARCKMVQHHLPSLISTESTNMEGGGCGGEGCIQMTTEIDYEHIAELTEGYSGSDIRLVCKEAAMRPVRKIFDILELHEAESKGPLPKFSIDPILTSDVEEALKRTKPSARTLQEKYEVWKEEFESV